MVDESLAELEQRRINIINRIDASASSGRDASKILQFPYQVTETSSSRGRVGGRPKGSKAKPPAKK
jgi:hypothetical protein